MAQRSAEELTGEIVGQYEALVGEAERCLGFARPNWIPDLTEVEKWNWVRRQIYLLYIPFTVMESNLKQIAEADSETSVKMAPRQMIGLLRFFIVPWLLVLWGDIASRANSSLTEPIRSGSQIFATVRIEDIGILILGVMVFVVFPLTAYWRVIELIRDKRFSQSSRQMLTGGLVVWLLSVFLWSFISSEGTTLASLSADLNAVTRPAILVYLFGLNLIPAFIVIYFMAIDFAIFALVLLFSIIGHIVGILNPRTTENISDLLSSPISQHGRQTWHLYDLDPGSLSTLGRWAEMNREGANLKTLPLVIFFAVGSILIAVSSVQEQVQAWLGWLVDSGRLVFLARVPSASAADPATGPTLLHVYVVFVAIVVLLAILKAVVPLFQAVAVQGLIAEACEVAKHVRARLDLELGQNTAVVMPAPVVTDRRGFVGRLVDRVLGN